MKKNLFLLLGLLMSFNVMAQTKTITGTVVDATNEPVIGASVVEAGTTNGTITDLDGKFSLNVSQGAKINVSYIGYKTQTVKPGEQRVLYIVLEEEAQKMDEVVVTGYFTKTKSSYTGSAVTVQAEELKRISPTNLFKALQAYEPSLQIVENNEYGSDPNKLPEILIRRLYRLF